MKASRVYTYASACVRENVHSFEDSPYACGWQSNPCYAIVLPDRKSGSGSDVGRILIGKASETALRPAEGRL
jgi:hypothetical protein